MQGLNTSVVSVRLSSPVLHAWNCHNSPQSRHARRLAVPSGSPDNLMILSMTWSACNSAARVMIFWICRGGSDKIHRLMPFASTLSDELYFAAPSTLSDFGLVRAGVAALANQPIGAALDQTGPAKPYTDAALQTSVCSVGVAPNTLSFRKGYADAPYDLRKARVTSECIESGIHPDPDQSSRAVSVGLLKPIHGSIFLAERER